MAKAANIASSPDDGANASPEEALAMKRELLALVEHERESDEKLRVWSELDRELVTAVRWITRVLRGES